MGSLLTIRHKDYRVFQTAFNWLIIFCVLQAWFFHSSYNQLFDLGGDDQYFYKDWILLGYTDINEVLTDYNPYKTFILPSVIYLKFLNYIGFNSTFSFHINLINIFLGAFIPVFVFKTARLFLKPVNSQYVALFVLFFPFLNYQCVKIIRDVDVYLLFTIFVYLLSSNRKVYAKIIWTLIITFLMFNVRKETVFYILIFLGSYLFFQSISFIKKSFFIFSVILALVFLINFLSTNYGFDFNTITRFSGLYDELRAETGGANSLATMLKNAGFFGKIISVPYVWLSPLPPPIIFSINIMSVLISLGSLVWYYLMPRGALQLYFESKNTINPKIRNLSLSLSITIILGSLFISYTSGDPRHTLIFFPIFSIFCFSYFENQNQKLENRVNYISVLIISLGIILYSLFKF